MKKLLNNPWFVGVLALVALAAVADSFRSAGGGAPVVAEADAEVPGDDPSASADSAASPGTLRDAIREIAVTANVRDPFSPRLRANAVSQPVEKAPPPDIVETVRLTALWTQGGATYALINERIHQAGDRIGGLTVETATQDGIWIRHWKGRDFLALGASFTLTTPALKAASIALSSES
jgi:hypothetical protein